MKLKVLMEFNDGEDITYWYGESAHEETWVKIQELINREYVKSIKMENIGKPEPKHTTD